MPETNATDSRLIVGLAQIAPVWLDRESTLEKIISSVESAAKENCSLVAFGETLLPGYPFWLSTTGGSKFNDEIQKDIHAKYLTEAVDISAGHLDQVAKTAKAHNIEVMLGCFEKGTDRGGHTGYCSLVRIDRQGTIANVHRKLMPTYEERLAWGIGDAHGLRTFELGRFTVGGLNCWENWMPLARTALYAQGENLHVAVWPGCKRNTIDITRFVALESRSFVISVGGLLRKSDVAADFPHRDLVLDSFDDDMISDGGSCIAAPDGRWIVEPVCDQEELIVEEIDFTEVLRERQNFDPSGHYSRPDVLQVTVNYERQNVLKEI